MSKQEIDYYIDVITIIKKGFADDHAYCYSASFRFGLVFIVVVNDSHFFDV